MIDFHKITYKIEMGKDGHLTENEINWILQKCFPHTTIDFFIETGTYHGDSTRAAANIFKFIHTIEIVEALYNENCEQYDIENIKYHLGDSLIILPEIVNELQEYTCFWFLDAHQSGPDTGNNGEWVPLLKEVEIIVKKSAHALIVIDDLRLFGRHWDWVSISAESIDSIFEKYQRDIKMKIFKNDRYIIAY